MSKREKRQKRAYGFAESATARAEARAQYTKRQTEAKKAA